jgi:hypothetical protein
MNHPLIIAAVLVAAVTPGIALQQGTLDFSSIVYAQEDWQAEFEDVCSKTQDAMTFSTEELKKLVARCDAIKPQIEKLPNESQRKVTLRRLQMCRNLFAFVLEDKQSRQQAAP